MESSTIPAAIRLAYSVADCSDHSSNFVPENVIHDRPSEPNSRWLSGQNPSKPGQKHWILLELEKESVLTNIKFGKHNKVNPCNMKDFKVYAGQDSKNMNLVLQAALKNDTVAESFPLRHTRRVQPGEGTYAGMNLTFPVKFVRIVPVTSYGQTFNTAIWHVALTGIQDTAYIEAVRAKHDIYRQTLVLRHILKHLRQRQLLPPFNALLSSLSALPELESTQDFLEHPEITSLHSALVLAGDFAEAENVIRRIASPPYNLFDQYLRSSACSPHSIWHQLDDPGASAIIDADGTRTSPGPRGGHSLCIDEENGQIWLFGGWDGHQSLDDLWCYDIAANHWTCVCQSTGAETKGPGRRSNAQMCFDPVTGCIYLFGKVGKVNVVPPVPVNVPDLASERGLGIDEQRYIAWRPSRPRSDGRRPPHGTAPPNNFGVDLAPSPPLDAHRSDDEGTSDAYIDSITGSSEFFRYHTRGTDQGRWDLLPINSASSGGPAVLFDHQMVLDAESQTIYVCGGRSAWDMDSGLYSYDIQTGYWNEVPIVVNKVGLSPTVVRRSGHSMVLDPALRTLFIIAGQREERLLPDMYAFDLNTRILTELFRDMSSNGGPGPSRYQRAVIDPDHREIYLFSGLGRDRKHSAYVTGNWAYRYDNPLERGTWTRIRDQDALRPQESVQSPAPRYAHQVVYDRGTKTTYMFGGNIGKITVESEDTVGATVLREEERRLDDFWSLRLGRVSAEEVTRKALFLIRQLQFRELCEEDSAVGALQFLRTQVSAVVNHGDDEEAEVFRALLAHLMSGPPSPVVPSGVPSKSRKRARNSPEGMDQQGQELNRQEDDALSEVDTSMGSGMQSAESGSRLGVHDRSKHRMETFQRVLEFVNVGAKEPAADLVDLIERADDDRW